MRWLIFGSKGWIGQQVCKLLNNMGEIVINAEARADNENDVEQELLTQTPDRVISLIGRTFGPGCNSIDYLEGKLVENLKDNLYGPLVLAMLCAKHNIHFTYLGTGCIFNGYEGYNENAIPNFYGSSYSVVKGYTDRLMHFFDNVLNVRIRMPITNEPHPRNFITKIMTYEKICSCQNSITVLSIMLPIMIDMVKNKLTGTINLTNPGLIEHNEILEMVKEILDSSFTWQNFSIEEQEKILSAGRSNNLLDTTKLQELYPGVLPIKDAVRQILIEMKNNSF